MPSDDLRLKADPAKLSLPHRARLVAGTVAGDLAATASRLLGKGSGASIRGQILTRIAPDAFGDLVKGRRIVAVSGTNGKTTTTHFVASALREALGPDAGRL
ncbi:MAG TPA: Mur ligase family protein, partial [Propioniciclava tarda]|nr:Mur ligase family protein [Propioniciclava tarda]